MAIQKVPVTLPDGSVSLVDMEMDALVHAVDQTGAYIGLVPEGTEGVHRTDSAPQGEKWNWTFPSEGTFMCLRFLKSVIRLQISLTSLPALAGLGS